MFAAKFILEHVTNHVLGQENETRIKQEQKNADA